MDRSVTATAPTGRTRSEGITALAARSHIPVVIVGAGINGLGTFHDLCQQGIDCLIVDKGDFCSGTSAAPSRMVHGGLKYMETGEFRLVAESVRERNRLLKNAPHLVRPLEMIIPTESLFGGEFASLWRFVGGTPKPAPRGRLIVKAGLAAYDFYSRKNRVAPAHRMISGWDLCATLPGINPGFRYAGSYYDAQITMPERLALELALDGLAANPGSIALNYVGVRAISEGRLVLRDDVTGTDYTVSTDIVINAAGPWIDRANAAMGLNSELVGGAKGSHILLNLPALHDCLLGKMIYFDPGDGRICLVTALAGKVLLGSTDIPVSSADDVVCEDHEVGYLFSALRRVFPKLVVSRRHIVFTYSGVRPLPISDATNPAAVSRDHSIAVGEPTEDRPFPIFSLIGGKWTTYRAFGAEACDKILAHLGHSRRQPTDDMVIGGGRELSASVADWESLTDEIADGLGGDRARAAILAQRYGSRAREVIARPTTQSPMLPSMPDISEDEIAFMATVEMCQTVADIALRRLPIALGGVLTKEVAQDIARVMGGVHGWSDDQCRIQISNLAEIMACRHRIDLRTGRYVGAASTR